MLPLDSPRWAELKDAYGSAANIPALLRQLETFPPSEGYYDEPWFSLWSALAHQGDVYSASFAAVPWIVHFLAKDPAKAGYSFFQFPARVEICRQKNKVTIPADLQNDYFDALKQLPSLAGVSLGGSQEEGFMRCALSAIAASNGSVMLAEAILELDPKTTEQFLEWLNDR